MNILVKVLRLSFFFFFNIQQSNRHLVVDSKYEAVGVCYRFAVLFSLFLDKWSKRDVFGAAPHLSVSLFSHIKNCVYTMFVWVYGNLKPSVCQASWNCCEIVSFCGHPKVAPCRTKYRVRPSCISLSTVSSCLCGRTSGPVCEVEGISKIFVPFQQMIKIRLGCSLIFLKSTLISDAIWKCWHPVVIFGNAILCHETVLICKWECFTWFLSETLKKYVYIYIYQH